jgi:hypothetical protein
VSVFTRGFNGRQDELHELLVVKEVAHIEWKDTARTVLRDRQTSWCGGLRLNKWAVVLAIVALLGACCYHCALAPILRARPGLI